MTKEKIQKILARAGYGSRRQIEDLVAQGRVEVSGRPVRLGERFSVSDDVTICLDGKPLALQKSPCLRRERLLLYHKPEGELVSRIATDGRPTIFRNLPHLSGSRWIAVGRLDINSSGLLLITTDGSLAHQLMHPRYQVEREYLVRVFGSITPKILRLLRSGVFLEDGMARFDTVSHYSGSGLNQWFKVTLKEGRNREVRRLWGAQGIQVNRLIRTRYANLALPEGLPPEKWLELPPEEISNLQKLLAPIRNSNSSC